MLHVGRDKVACGEGGGEAELAGEDASGDDAGELAGVRAGRGGVGAADAEQVEHGGLRGEEGAAADGADLDRGHGDGDLEAAVVAVTRGWG